MRGMGRRKDVMMRARQCEREKRERERDAMDVGDAVLEIDESHFGYVTVDVERFLFFCIDSERQLAIVVRFSQNDVSQMQIRVCKVESTAGPGCARSVR